MMQESNAMHTQSVSTPNKSKGAYRKRIAHTVYSVIGGSILLLAGMPPIPANAELAPNCVKASVDNGIFTDILTVTNTCEKPKRIKIVLGRHTDIECESYNPGQSRSYRYASTATFDRLEKC